MSFWIILLQSPIAKNTEKKMATFLKKLNNQRKLSLPIPINLTRKKQCTEEVR